MRDSDAAISVTPFGTVAWCDAIGISISAHGQDGANDRVRDAVQSLLACEPRPEARESRVGALSRGYTQLAHVDGAADLERLRERIEAAAAEIEAPSLVGIAFLERMRLTAAHYRGDIGETRAAMLRLLVAYESIDDARGACQTRIWLASTELWMGAFEHAIESATRAEAAAKRLGAPYLATWARYARSKQLVECDEPGARDALLALLELDSSPRIRAGIHLQLGLLALVHREAEVARAEADRALAAHDTRSINAPALAMKARACALLGLGGDALAHARDALAILDRIGPTVEFDMFVRFSFADAAMIVGEREAATHSIRATHEELLRRAASLHDAGDRDAFLERPRVHADIRRLFRELTQ